MTRLPTIDRDRVLDGAEALICELGPTSLTFDALAARTGVSKGGLQYVFKSKDGLIRAMMQRLADQSQTSLERAHEALTVEKRLAVWLESIMQFRPSGVHNAVLAAVVRNPKVLDDFAASYRAQLNALAADDIPQERVIAISLAADGLMLGELLGLVRLTPAERERVVNEVIGLARGVAG